MITLLQLAHKVVVARDMEDMDRIKIVLELLVMLLEVWFLELEL